MADSEAQKAVSVQQRVDISFTQLSILLEPPPLPLLADHSDDGDINFWTFAMLGISSTFLIFVGFSIVIMW